MSLKRKRPISVGEIIEYLADEPEDYESAWKNLKASLRLSSQNTVKKLAPSSISVHPKAAKLFGLIKGHTDLFEEVKDIPIPQYLKDSIERVFAVSNFLVLDNEAFSRTILDQILISSVYEEGIGSVQPVEHSNDPAQSSHGHPHPSAAGIQEEAAATQETAAKKEAAGIQEEAAADQETAADQEDPARLELLHETPFSKLVMHDGESKLLSGYADYSIWYESAAKKTMATNLLIVEAKRWEHTDNALGQLLAYMGIVHTTRKKEKRENSVVYGMASDGRKFRFCRIDNSGVYTMSSGIEWDRQPDKVYSILRTIIRVAALLSPSTTPIKDPQKRRIILSAFGSPTHNTKLDIALRKLEVLEADEDDPDLNL